MDFPQEEVVSSVGISQLVMTGQLGAPGSARGFFVGFEYA